MGKLKLFKKSTQAAHINVKKLKGVAGSIVGIGIGTAIAGVPNVHANDGSGSSGDSGDSGDSGASDMSTPFLCTWNGERFVFENDFLLGTPTTFYSNFVSGKKAYEEGKTGPDLYRIRNSFSPKDGNIVFQIKEIEAEESFIDYINLTSVVYPKTAELIVDSQHREFYVFDKEELKQRKGIIRQDIFVRGVKAPSALGESARVIDGGGADKGKEYILDAGDTVEIRGKVDRTDNPLFLLLGSRYRDWTAGEIFEKNSYNAMKEMIRDALPTEWSVGALSRGVIRVSGLALVLGVLMLSGAIANVFATSPKAYAEVPTGTGTGDPCDTEGGCPSTGDGHSLLIESYWDWSKKAFHLATVIHPRHNQYSVDAVSLPKEAVSKTGEVRVRITATKRHYVNLASLFVSKKQLKAKTETLFANKVFHNRLQKDHSNIVGKKHTEGYLHTVAGDVVDVSFKPSSRTVRSDEQQAHLFHATGFYTPLSAEGRKIAGNWVEKLDSDSRALLKDMYPLKNYHSSDRSPVLS